VIRKQTKVSERGQWACPYCNKLNRVNLAALEGVELAEPIVTGNCSDWTCKKAVDLILPIDELEEDEPEEEAPPMERRKPSQAQFWLGVIVGWVLNYIYQFA